MATLHLVRHGHAAAGWGDDRDPGLDEIGAAQARAVGDRLAADVARCALVSSPLRRAQETAQPLSDRWDQPVRIDPAFGEIPSPTDDLHLRQVWLGSALAGTWDGLDPTVQRWRERLVAAVRSLEQDAVVFTHFVAINAVVSAITLDPAVTVFLPANASVTTVSVGELGAGSLRVMRLGEEAPPQVG